MPVYKVPEKRYEELLQIGEYKAAYERVSYFYEVIPYLRKSLRKQLAEANRNLKKWNADTTKFKKFLEQNQKDLKSINVTTMEINFIFKKIQCQLVTITTSKGEYKFTINLELATELAGIIAPNDERSVARNQQSE